MKIISFSAREQKNRHEMRFEREAFFREVWLGNAIFESGTQSEIRAENDA